MSDRITNDDQVRRISAAFALVTAKLEDAAGLAASGQRSRPNLAICDLSFRIGELANEVVTIAAILELLSDDGGCMQR
jgi:hypothetical protein